MATDILYIEAKHLSDLDRVARMILDAFPGKRLFFFYGAMGVGKTTLIKAVCQQLGVSEIVSSPTFSIINEYSLVGDQRVFHFDFYRLKKVEEVYDLGYEDYFYSGSYCFVEWPEKLESLKPENSVDIHMEDKDGIRIIRV
jgi:tRNA threonylcarbamoyladenosine biosynthesis protein TsaE